MPVPSTIGVAQIILSAQSDQLTKGFLEAQKKIAAFVSSVKGVGSAFLSIAAIQKAAGFIESTGAAILATQKLADQFGMTNAAYLAMQVSAELAGVGQDQFAASLSHLQVEMAGLAVENRQQVDDFAAIGVAMSDLAGKNFSAQIAVIAEKMSAMQDATARAAAATKLFGDQGRQLLPMLAQGAAGFKAQADAAKAFGLGVNPDDTEKVRQASDAFGVLGLTAEDTGKKFVAWIAPIGTIIAEVLTVGIGFAKDLGRALDATFQGVMGVGATIGGMVTWVVAGVIEGFGQIGAVVENFGNAMAKTWAFIKAASESPIDSITYEFTQMFAKLSRMDASLLEGLSNYVEYFNHGMAQSFYESGLKIRKAADEADIASRKTYKNINANALAASNDMANAWGSLFEVPAQVENAFDDMSSWFFGAANDDANAFVDGWTKSIHLASTRGAFDFSGAMTDHSAEAAAKAAADAAKRIAEAARLTAEQEELKRRNRAALLSSADADPRVRYEQDVAQSLSQVSEFYSADQAKEDADNRAEQAAFYADPDSDPRKVYEERVQELIADIHTKSEIAEAEKDERDKATRREYLAGALGDVATLAGAYASQSKAMFIASKVAAMAQAEVNAWIAYSNVLANKSILGPEVAFVEAGLALAAGQVAVANIAAQQAPGRANGGPVSGGRTYLVGERGPELLTMGGNGHVTPNSAMGPGGAPKVTVNIHGATSTPRVQQTTDSQGNQNIAVIFDQIDTMIAGGYATGTSKSAKALERKYGLNGARGAH